LLVNTTVTSANRLFAMHRFIDTHERCWRYVQRRSSDLREVSSPLRHSDSRLPQRCRRGQRLTMRCWLRNDHPRHR
jgi:hypothetical protein